MLKHLTFSQKSLGEQKNLHCCFNALTGSSTNENLDKPALMILKCFLLDLLRWSWRYLFCTNSESQILQTYFCESLERWVFLWSDSDRLVEKRLLQIGQRNDLSSGFRSESCSSSRCLVRSDILKKWSSHEEHLRDLHSPLAMWWCRSYGEFTFNLQCLHFTGLWVPSGRWWKIFFYFYIDTNNQELKVPSLY